MKNECCISVRSYIHTAGIPYFEPGAGLDVRRPSFIAQVLGRDRMEAAFKSLPTDTQEVLQRTALRIRRFALAQLRTHAPAEVPWKA